MWDSQIRLLVSIENRTFDLYDICSDADRRKAAKIIGTNGMLSTSGLRGNMLVHVKSSDLDKFISTNLGVRLDDQSDMIKELEQDVSVFRNGLWDLMTAVKRGFKRDIIDGMLDEICQRIDEREQRVYTFDTVEIQHSKKLLEYCTNDRLQCGDSVEYHDRKGRIIAAGWTLGQRHTVTVAFDDAMRDRMTFPEDSRDVKNLMLA